MFVDVLHRGGHVGVGLQALGGNIFVVRGALALLVRLPLEQTLHLGCMARMAIFALVREVHQARLDDFAVPFADRGTIWLVGAADTGGPLRTLFALDDLLRVPLAGVVDEHRRLCTALFRRP